jgi:MarR family transcriptional regulator, temperature-dependent positive regulator of motility
MSTSNEYHVDRPHLGSLLRRSQQLHARMWSACVSEEVTSPQSAVLAAIRHEEALDFRTISRRACLDRSTLAGVVDRLARRGLVRRRRDPDDPRRYLLSITPKGIEVATELAQRSDALNNRLLEILEPSDRPELLRLLRLYVAEADRIFGAAYSESAVDA